MRILFLSPRQPLPARSGAKLREYHFLRALGQAGEVTYLYFSDPGAAPLTQTDLPFCWEVVAVPKPPAYGIGKTLLGVAGPWPLPILNYTSQAMSAVVARVLGEGNYDILHLDSIHMIRYAMQAVKLCKKPPLAIYNWHNIESEAMQRFSDTIASFSKRAYAQLTASKLEICERQILREAYGHIVCSVREREQLVQQAPGARINVVENGVDTTYFGDGGSVQGETRRLVFVGAMDYFPNSDAATFFAANIWPGVRERLGAVELTIVGSNPGRAVRELGQLPGITVTGMVPDVRPWYHGAFAAIVPLRTGAGTRLKILEAMAAGVPVISTPLGAEGLEVLHGGNILLAEPENTQAWLDGIALLAESEEQRTRLTEAALQLVRGKYDWEILGAKLRDTYQDWLSRDR